jgi:isopropylmalate/homocitrate/citramalate synthase
MSSEAPWHVEGKWFASPGHWADEVRGSITLPERVFFKDTTLQEGADSTGALISWGDRLTLVRMLVDIGVTCVKMPHDISLKELADFISAMDRAGIKVEKSYTGIIRKDNWKERFQRHIDAGVDSEELIILADGFDPGAPFHQFGEGGISKESAIGSREELIELVSETIQFLKEQGIKTIFSWPDTIRSNIDVVRDLYAEGVKAGADRVYVWDSVGCAVPSVAAYYVSQVKEAIGDSVPICAQFHNDLGTATGNAFSAVEAGVTWVDSAVNGLGDRGGLVAFEEIVCLLEMYGIHTGIRTEGLYELCTFAAKAWSTPVQRYKPISGDTWCLEEAHFGIGQGALEEGALEAPMALNPQVVGREYRNVIGTTTLYRGGIEMKLAEWGYEPTEQEIRDIVLRAHESIGSKKYIEEEEFKSICDGVMLSTAPASLDVLTVL